MRDPDQPTVTRETVLAALRRAALHRTDRDSAPIWAVREHLGVTTRSAEGRAVRAHLAAFERDGLAVRESSHGVPVWSLTAAGRRALARAERSADPPLLGESPQHRAWRNARAVAAQEIERFAKQLADDLDRASETLRTADPSSGRGAVSDDWLLLGSALATDARRLASAWYCLHEWKEPGDDAPDVEEPSSDELRSLRAGRRNVRLWGTSPGGGSAEDG